jgi:hypothetical protein
MGALNHIPPLAIPPEQPPDPLAQYGKMQSIAALGAQRQQQQAMMPGQLEQQRQQIEAAALENQQKTRTLKQGQALDAAFQGALTPDPVTGQPKFDSGKVISQVAASGNGSLVPQLTETFTKLDQGKATLLKTKQEAASQMQDYMGSLGAEIKAAGYTPGAAGVALAHLSEVDPNAAAQLKQQFTADPTSIQKMADAAIAASPKQQQAVKDAAQAGQATAETNLKSAQLTGAQGSGIAPGVPLENQEAAAWLKQNPTKNLADYAKYHASLNPIAQIQAANSAGGGLQQTAIDQAAERYATTGQLPPAARGVAGLAQNRQIMNRAAELHPEGNLAENSAEYAANKSSLTGLQKNFDQVSAFENTAGKNLDVFLKTAKSVVDSGSPWINQPLRSVATGALGSSDQAAFNAARQTAVTEIAKVLNSSNASGVLSDSARHEVEGLIGPTATLKQIYSAANILKQDMANRHQAYQDQINDIKSRGVKPGNQPQQNAQPPSQSQGAGTGEAQKFSHVSASGDYGWDGTQWVKIAKK